MPINRSQKITMQSAVVATGNGTAMQVAGYVAVDVQLVGTFSATVTFEGTVDGTNFVSINAINHTTGLKSATATATGVYRLSVAGLELIRARVSSYTSGNVTAIGEATTEGDDLAALSVSSVEESGHQTIGTQRKTCAVAATAEQFTAQACKVVAVTALENNTDTVVVGDSSVVALIGTRRGTPLQPGESGIFPVANVNLLYIDAVVSGEGVSYTWYN